jgi:Transglycosylase SLT domain
MADALYNAILGETPKSNIAFSDDELDRLKSTESSGNPFAVNKDTGAMGAYQFMPATVAQFHEKGIKFNPFDEKQSREVAKNYLNDLATKLGSKEKALAAYGGFVTKDPTSYVNKVLIGEKPKEVASNDPLYNAIMGVESKTQQPIEQPKTQETRPSMMETMNRAMKTNAPIAENLASLGDVLYGAVPGTVGAVTYAGGRALGQTPEEAVATSQKVTGAISQPFGKALGVTQTAGYQNEGARQIMDKIGQYIGESADVIAQKTGIPKSDVENMLGTLGLLAGKGAELGSKSIGAALKAREVPASELAAFRGKQTPLEITMEEQPKELKGVGAAQSEYNPYPSLTGEEGDKEFKSLKFAKMAGNVEPAEQRTRAQIINEINPEGRPRTGLLTGNENTIRNEYVLANSSERTPAGEILKQEIAKEQNALPKYAQNIISETGADRLLPNDEARAYRIRQALDDKEGLAKTIDDAKKQLYEEAFNKVGNNPVDSSTIENLLNSKQFQGELKLKKLTDFTAGAKDLLDLHKTEGFEGTAPGSIAGLEKLRQSINKGWSPENSFAVRRAVRAIDEDIAKAGGVETYQKARALHQAEQNLFGSKGIKDLLTEEDNNGVQTGISNEKLIQKLNTMPRDQWAHIYDVLNKTANGEIVGVTIPLEVREAAKAAQAEMKGAIARDIYESGSKNQGEWNSSNVTNKLNFYNSKIKHAFDPTTIQKFHTLNLGGHLMPAKNPYEGGGLQLQRVAKLSEKLPLVGKGLGAATGSPIATLAGGKLGEVGSRFFNKQALKKEAELLEKELEKNKKLGTKLSDIANLGKK